jgi:hypothetical protein
MRRLYLCLEQYHRLALYRHLRCILAGLDRRPTFPIALDKYQNHVDQIHRDGAQETQSALTREIRNQEALRLAKVTHLMPLSLIRIVDLG